MRKRTLALLLALLLLAGSAVSCGTNGSGTPAETEQTGTETGEERTAAVRSLSELPDDLDFKGADFVVASRGTNCSVNQEEITGEGTLDATYNRNRMAEDKLKVKISDIKSEDTKLEAMLTSVKAGERLYSAGLTHITAMKNYLLDGYFMDTENVPYLDLTKPYWYETAVDSLELSGRQYLFLGDICIQDSAWLTCIFFNKEMMEDLGLGSPYEPLKEGSWTFDRFTADTAAAARDLNGDGRWDWSIDQFGATNLYAPLGGFYNAMGQLSVIRNDDGTLAFNLGCEASVNALMKLAGWVHSGCDTYLLDVERVDSGDPFGDLVNVFVSGRALFHIGTVATTSDMRDMEQPFGILPMPKYDERQERYITSTQDWAQCVYGVSIGAPDVAMAGAVLEYLGGLSTDTVRAAYYDKSLKRKLSRDQESAVTLDILFDNMVTDTGFSYFGLRSMVEDMAKSGTVSSKLQSIEKSTNKTIKTSEKIIAKLDY